MWNCGNCGCRAIAPGVPFCPQCYTTKEDCMARITVGGGASNERDEALRDPDPLPEAPGESAVADEAPQEAPEAPQEPAEPQDTPVDPGTAPRAAPDVLADLEAAAAALKRPAKAPDE